jgi:O-antigen/teichoic acid export membrane protein
MVMTNVFSPEKIGLYGFVWAFGYIFWSFLDLGFTTFSLKEHATKNIFSFIGNIIRSKRYFDLILIVFFILIKFIFFPEFDLFLILIILFIMITHFYMLIYLNVLRCNERFHISSFIEFSHSFLIFGLVLFAVVVLESLVWVFIMYLFVKLILLGGLAFYYRKPIKNYKMGSPSLKVLFKRSWPFFFTSMSWFLLYRLDLLILGFFSFFEQIAYYEASYVIISNLGIVIMSTLAIYLPRFTKVYGKKSFFKLNRYYKSHHWLMFSIFLFIFSGVLVFRKVILSILYPPVYLEYHLILVILSVGGFFNFLGIYNANYLLAIGKQKLNVLILTTGIFLNFSLNIFLIPVHGIFGAAYATLISYGLIYLSQTIIIRSLSIFRNYKNE